MAGLNMDNSNRIVSTYNRNDAIGPWNALSFDVLNLWPTAYHVINYHGMFRGICHIGSLAF